MYTNLRTLSDKLIGVRQITPNQQRRGRLLARLIILTAFLDVVFVLYNLWAWLTFGLPTDQTALYIGLLGFPVLLALWTLNRRGYSYLAAAAIGILYFCRIALIANPERFTVAFWAFLLPILIAGYVLKPWYSFLAAGLAVVVFLLMTDRLDISETLDIIVFKIIILFLLALLTYLTASHLDWTIETAQRSEAKYRNLFNDMPIGIYRTTAQGDILDANPAFLEMFGFADLDSLQGLRAGDLYADPSSREQNLSAIEQTRTPEMQMRRSDGTLFWVTDHVQPIRDASRKVLYYEGSLIDITERKKAEQKLEHLAMTDPLIGIHNRRHFFDLAEQSIQESYAPLRTLAILMIDLDHFKNVNDQNGHAVGDAVLQEAVRRIRVHLRAGDICGRYGGEEFCVLLADIGQPEIIQVADRLCESIGAAPVTVDRQEIFVTASMGVAIMGTAPLSLDVLLQRADQALYAAKQAGRNQWKVWTPALKISL